MSNGSKTPPDNESLWPKVIVPMKLKAPVAILKEQASFLGQQTQNVIIAEVRNRKPGDPDDLAYSFVLVAPALNNYRLELFTVEHQAAKIYPLVIHSEFLAIPPRPIMRLNIQNETSFKGALKSIFSGPKVVQAIQSLLAQSEGFTPPKEPEF